VALSWADLEERVRKLTDIYRDSGDRIYSVVCYCGTLLATTKVGLHRGTKKDVGWPILKQIPRQLHVSGRFWRDVVRCTHGRDDYLEERGHGDCVSEHRST
jgi:hypothetical protein